MSESKEKVCPLFAMAYILKKELWMHQSGLNSPECIKDKCALWEKEYNYEGHVKEQYCGLRR